MDFAPIYIDILDPKGEALPHAKRTFVQQREEKLIARVLTCIHQCFDLLFRERFWLSTFGNSLFEQVLFDRFPFRDVV
jgi:hypothetical protein